jgi:CHAT domain-containing protein
MFTGGLTQSVQGFAPLPHVAWEVEEAGRYFSTHTLLDEAFRSEEVERALRAVPYDVLHIASHAEFAANPEDSFILTWDGRLSLERLAATLGQARFRIERPVELLVLSACETAVGDERSALGLAGAALRMGARSVLASLWAVNDDASSRLMARFYRELANPKHTRASALQAAQLWMFHQEDFEHPIDWAAFLLIGSWL